MDVRVFTPSIVSLSPSGSVIKAHNLDKFTHHNVLEHLRTKWPDHIFQEGNATFGLIFPSLNPYSEECSPLQSSAGAELRKAATTNSLPPRKICKDHSVVLWTHETPSLHNLLQAHSLDCQQGSFDLVLVFPDPVPPPDYVDAFVHTRDTAHMTKSVSQDGQDTSDEAKKQVSVQARELLSDLVRNRSNLQADILADSTKVTNLPQPLFHFWRLTDEFQECNERPSEEPSSLPTALHRSFESMPPNPIALLPTSPALLPYFPYHGRPEFASINEAWSKLRTGQHLANRLTVSTTWGAGAGYLARALTAHVLSNSQRGVVYLPLSPKPEPSAIRNALVVGVMNLALPINVESVLIGEIFDATAKASSQNSLRPFYKLSGILFSRLREVGRCLEFIVTGLDLVSLNDQDDLYHMIDIHHSVIFKYVGEPDSQSPLSKRVTGHDRISVRGLQDFDAVNWLKAAVKEVTLNDESIKDIVQVTGGTPRLLLEAACRIKEEKKYHSKLLNDLPSLSRISNSIRSSINMFIEDKTSESDIAHFLVAVITEGVHYSSAHALSGDPAFRGLVYRDESGRRKTIGLLAQIAFRTHLFTLGNQYYAQGFDRCLSAMHATTNPSSLGFATESAVGFEIITSGLNHSKSGISFPSRPKVHNFDTGSPPSVTPEMGLTHILFPNQYNHPFVDIILIKFTKKRKGPGQDPTYTAVVILLQVSLVTGKKKHTDSPKSFFKPDGNWTLWKAALPPNIEIEWRFLWILCTPLDKSDVATPESPPTPHRRSNRSNMQNQPYTEFVASFQAVVPRTAKTLDDIATTMKEYFPTNYYDNNLDWDK